MTDPRRTRLLGSAVAAGVLLLGAGCGSSGPAARPERTPTHLAHVFRLAPDPQMPSRLDEATCNRIPDGEKD